MALNDFLYGKDVLLWVLDAGQQTAVTTDDYATSVKGAVLQAYWDCLAARKWPFALASTPAVLSTVAKQAVTVSSISGTALTLSAALTPSMAGYKFYLDGQQAIYRVTAHTAATTAVTLDASYVETPTSGAGTFFKDEYALTANCIRPWGPFWYRGQPGARDIDLLDNDEFKGRFGHGTLSSGGYVEAVTPVRDQAMTAGGNGLWTVQVAPWSEDAVNLEYDYTEFDELDFSGTGLADTPKIPRHDRIVIGYRALFHLLRTKDDNLADSAELEYQRKISEMEGRYCPSSRKRMWVRSRNSLGVA